MLNWIKELRGTDDETIAFRNAVHDRNMRDFEAVKGKSHEEQGEYFYRISKMAGYQPTAAFRMWFNEVTRRTIANAQWSAWERICNERKAAR